MQKLKNKRRLTTLVIAFLLVFVTGSAFALQPGMLDIVGTVNLQIPGYVRWHTATAVPNNTVGLPIVPAGQPLGAVQNANIVDRATVPPNVTDQRIVWNMYFVHPGEFQGVTEHIAVLTATAINDSSMTAIIDAATFSWEDDTGAPLNPALYGLSVNINQGAFSGVGNPLAAGATSAPVIVTVTWDGTLPNTFSGPGTHNALTGRHHAFAARLVIEFDYAPL